MNDQADLLTEAESDLSRASIQEWLEAFPETAPAVVVPVYNAYEDVVECIESLLATLPEGTPLVIIDDASTDVLIQRTLEQLSAEHAFLYIRKRENTGFVGTVNVAFRICAPRDVVIVNSDVIVPPHWLERLRAAAYSRSTVATATPLTNNGTILSVPHRNQPVYSFPQGMTTAQLDQRIQAASLQLYPIIPTAIGHCTYFKRSALSRVGGFDDIFAPGYGEEVDFSQRAVIAGLCHVAADDLFVFHKGSRSFDAHGRAERLRIQHEHEKIVAARYPWYHSWIMRTQQEQRSSLAVAIERARAAITRYRIAIDVTYVDGWTTGTQVLALELLRALLQSANQQYEITLIVSDAVPMSAFQGLDTLAHHMRTLAQIEAQPSHMFDLVHRPFQVRTEQDLALLQRLGRRVIISHLDCIAFANPSYAVNSEHWFSYRELIQHTFALADGITFISEDARQDATHHGLIISAERTCVTYAGVDHVLHAATSDHPQTEKSLQDQPFLLVFGTNFKHKNRVYALKLFYELVQKYQWPGNLVIAGPETTNGGSNAEEALERLQHPQLRDRVRYLGIVGEREKQWLFRHAALVIYPSMYEGFGLVPFEAALAGRPALTTRSTALQEVLGEDVRYLETLNEHVDVDGLWELLSDPQAAQQQVAAIRARSDLFSWSSVAQKTWEFYQHVLQLPLRTPLTTETLPTMLPAHNVATPQSSPPQPKRSTASQDTPAAWMRRVVRAVKVWRAGGWGAVRTRTKEFILWRLSRS